MDLKSKIEISIKSGDHDCMLLCNNNAPLGFLFDSLCEMKAYIVKRIQEEEAKEQKQEEVCEKKECCQE